MVQYCFHLDCSESEDYNAVFQSLNFGSLEQNQQQCVTVLIIDDAVLEDREAFVLQLKTTDSYVSLNPSTSVVEVLDDDSKGGKKDLFCKVIS